jgi:hypothetical protein
MRRIRSFYYLVIIIWILISIILLVINKTYKWLTIEDSSFILSIIAGAVSILSLGLATMKGLSFEGNVSCWHIPSQSITANNNSIVPIGTYNLITFKIDNQSKEPIKSLTVNFRVPSMILCKLPGHNHYLNYFEFKDTTIITATPLKFLGNTKGDCDLILEHYLNIESWDKQRVIYITIAGDNITPTTFKLKFDEKQLILNSNSTNPYKINKV